VKLKAFSKFDNTTEALAAATSLVDSKLGKGANAKVAHNMYRSTSLMAFLMPKNRSEEFPQEACSGRAACSAG
jgi:hypothetical protein